MDNGVGLNQVDGGKVGFSGFVGAASGVLDISAGLWASNKLRNAIKVFRVQSPVISNKINGFVEGSIGGYAGGFTARFLLSGGYINVVLSSVWRRMEVAI